MARNEEKHAGRLNRLWLQKLDEENLKKNPKRPGLGSLHTAEAVKEWLPSIKRDIDFYLKQSQVTCYPKGHIEDFSSKIESLTKEYKAYVRKLRELDPDIKSVPWTERAYQRKHSLSTQSDGKQKKMKTDDDHLGIDRVNDNKETLSFTPVTAPILDNDDAYTSMYGYRNEAHTMDLTSHTEVMDKPLVFHTSAKNNLQTQQQIENVQHQTVAWTRGAENFPTCEPSETAVSHGNHRCTEQSTHICSSSVSMEGSCYVRTYPYVCLDNNIHTCKCHTRPMINVMPCPISKTAAGLVNYDSDATMRQREQQSKSNTHSVLNNRESTGLRGVSNISLYIPYSESSSESDDAKA